VLLAGSAACAAWWPRTQHSLHSLHIWGKGTTSKCVYCIYNATDSKPRLKTCNVVYYLKAKPAINWQLPAKVITGFG